MYITEVADSEHTSSLLATKYTRDMQVPFITDSIDTQAE